MATSYFSDGFPTNPMDAIKACDFLSDKEKQEWEVWLQSSNDEQKRELVETLHAIYIDQKAPVQPQPPTNTAPAFNPQNNQQNNQNENNFQPNFAPFPPQNIPPQNQNPYPQAQFQNQPFPPFNPNQPFPAQPFVAPAQPPINNQPPQPNFNFPPAPFTPAVQPNSNPFPLPIFNQEPIAEPKFEEEAPIQNANNDSSVNPLDDNFYKQTEAEFLREMAELEPKAPEPETKPIEKEADKVEIKEPNFFDTNSNQFDNNPIFNPEKKENKNNFANQGDNSGFQPRKNKPQAKSQNQNSNQAQNSDSNPSSNDNKKIDTSFTDKQNRNSKNQNKSETSEPNQPQADKPVSIPQNSEDAYLQKAESMMLSANEVTDLYAHFLDTQTKSVNLEKEFQDKQAKLFNKIMEMVSEASIISDKVLNLNYKMVDNSKAIQELKNATQVKGNTSLQFQVNSLRDDLRKLERNFEYSLERMERDFNDFRNDISSRVDEMSTQVVSALSDTYKADGMHEKIAKLQAKLEARIESLEKKSPTTSAVIFESKPPITPKLSVDIPVTPEPSKLPNTPILSSTFPVLDDFSDDYETLLNGGNKAENSSDSKSNSSSSKSAPKAPIKEFRE